MIHHNSYLLWLIILIVFCSWAGYAQAHQQKAAITRIELNPRTNALEIMHRFAVHDAEHAVSELFKGTPAKIKADIFNNQDTQARFAKYVSERFGMYLPNNTPLPLELVGHEIDGKHFWIYQETPMPKTLEGVQVVHNALRDIWYDQSNIVNIKLNDQKDTLSFVDNVEVLKVAFNTTTL